MSTASEISPNGNTIQRNELARIITNAYRARHGLPPLDVHAAVDEDIAEAIIHAGWNPPEATSDASIGKNKGSDKIAFLSDSLAHGVGSNTSARAQHIRRIASEVMDEHSDWTDRNNQHSMHCIVDNAPWPCPEYETAKAAYVNAGGNQYDF